MCAEVRRGTITLQADLSRPLTLGGDGPGDPPAQEGSTQVFS